MPVETQNDYVVVPGKADILIGFSPVGTQSSIGGYERLYKLGESVDSIRIQKVPLKNPVPGDRHGGQGGLPIESQFLGYSINFSVELSRVDKEVVRRIERMNGLLPRAGRVPLNRIGALLHQNYGYRVLLFSVRDYTRSINLPCAMMSEPHGCGVGTKFESFSFGFEGVRVDRGMWQAVYDANLISEVYNRDFRGLDATYLAQYGYTTGIIGQFASELTAPTQVVSEVPVSPLV